MVWYGIVACDKTEDRLHIQPINLLFKVFVVIDVGDDEVQVVFDAETIFDAAHRRRQRIVGQVHTYRYSDTCNT